MDLPLLKRRKRSDRWRTLQVEVTEVEGNPGYYASKFFLRPHYQLEGLTVSLRLVSGFRLSRAENRTTKRILISQGFCHPEQLSPIVAEPVEAPQRTGVIRRFTVK